MTDTKILDMVAELYCRNPDSEDIMTEELVFSLRALELRIYDLNKVLKKENRFKLEDINWINEPVSKFYN